MRFFFSRTDREKTYEKHVVNSPQSQRPTRSLKREIAVGCSGWERQKIYGWMVAHQRRKHNRYITSVAKDHIWHEISFVCWSKWVYIECVHSPNQLFWTSGTLELDGELLFYLMVVSWSRATGGTPSHHQFRTMGFSLWNKPSSYWGSPMTSWKPPYLIGWTSLRPTLFGAFHRGLASAVQRRLPSPWRREQLLSVA